MVRGPRCRLIIGLVRKLLGQLRVNVQNLLEKRLAFLGCGEVGEVAEGVGQSTLVIGVRAQSDDVTENRNCLGEFGARAPPGCCVR